MEKEQLIQIAKKLYQEAMLANCFFLIMQQHREYYEKYSEEINLSPAFYQLKYNALQTACFVEIAKLYEKSSETHNIGKLLLLVKNNVSLFSQYLDELPYKLNGNKQTISVPYYFLVNEIEERLLCKMRKTSQESERLFRIQDRKTGRNLYEFTFNELIDLFQLCFNAMSKKINTVRMQRNKMYVHNDPEYFLQPEKENENPLYYSDLQDLIDFALNVTILVLTALTKERYPRKYGNIKDWENTLFCAKIGLKYREEEIKKMENQL